jgi:RNA polymerase sigma-70 factor (family 1)
MNDLSGYNDDILVSELKNNEARAFDILFYKYSNKLFSFSFSLLKNNEDSKEIVQETFLRIWYNRNEIDPHKSFKSFLFTISYNLIMDRLRLRMKDKEYRKFLEYYFEYKETGIRSESDYEILKKEIERAIEELPEKRKNIFKLSREEELSHKEIAEKLDIKVKTVENQINLALKHIKVRISKIF